MYLLCEAERPLLVDLCCGFKGVSNVARARGWRVVTLDISLRVKPDVVGDLRSLPLRVSPDLLWISPDCTTYSRWRLPWFGKPEPDTTLMRAAATAVHALRPKSFVIENVPAAESWCEPFLGSITHKTWGHIFWSDLPCLIPQLRPHKMCIPAHTSTTHWRRSIMPAEVVHPFLVAAERRLGL